MIKLGIINFRCFYDASLHNLTITQRKRSRIVISVNGIKLTISTEAGVAFVPESNDLSSIQDIQGKGLAGLIKPILDQGEPLIFISLSLARTTPELLIRIQYKRFTFKMFYVV